MNLLITCKNKYFLYLFFCVIISCNNEAKNHNINNESNKNSINQFLEDNLNRSIHSNDLFLENLHKEQIKCEKIKGINCNFYEFLITSENRIFVLEDADTKYKVFIDNETNYAFYSSPSFRSKVDLPPTYPLIINNSLSCIKDFLNKSNFVKELDSIPISSIDTIIKFYLGKSDPFIKVNNNNIENCIASYKSSLTNDNFYNPSMVDNNCATIKRAICQKGTIVYFFDIFPPNRKLFFVFCLETKISSNNEPNIMVKKYIDKCANKGLFFNFYSYIL